MHSTFEIALRFLHSTIVCNNYNDNEIMDITDLLKPAIP